MLLSLVMHLSIILVFGKAMKSTSMTSILAAFQPLGEEQSHCPDLEDIRRFGHRHSLVNVSWSDYFVLQHLATIVHIYQH